MRIGGLQKLSLIDYPGKIAAVVFTQGCNLRCPFCHNPELVIAQQFGVQIAEHEVLSFLQSRRKYLQGVVISGGEPTIQIGLIEFLRKIKNMNYAIKLDTNGTRPVVLQEIIAQGLVDYIAMDVKTSFKKYPQAAGVEFEVNLIKQSIELILRCRLKHEFRTTAVKSLCGWEDFLEITKLVKGACNYKIQKFCKSDKLLDPRLLNQEEYSAKELGILQQFLGWSDLRGISPRMKISPDT